MQTEITILLISTVLLLVLVGLIVRFSMKLGMIFGIGAFSLSFILMSFATSIPEIIIGFVSSSIGVGEIGVGVAIGSSITSITLITGIIALITDGIETKNVFRNRQALVLLFIASFSILTILDGQLTRFDGFILITSYLVYLYELWYSRAQDKTKAVKLHYTEFMSTFTVIIISIIGAILVSSVMLDSSINISNELGITPILFGVLLISTITAVPELIFEYLNIRRKKERLALGDLIGSVGTNASLVIGLIAVIGEVTIEINAITSIILFFFAASIIVFVSFLFTRQRLEAKEGIMLIFIYVAFLLGTFLASLTLL
jgi:cation:H+ antiporter